MLMSTLLATVADTTSSLEWRPVVGGIMVAANIVAIALGKAGMKYPSAPPAAPASNFFGGFGLPAILATTSFGHILGAGVILGLHNIGKI